MRFTPAAPRGATILRLLAIAAGLSAAVATAVAVLSPSSADAAGGTPLPTYDVAVQPYTTEAADPNSCYQFDWLKFHSPTTPATPYGPAMRYLHVAGSGSDVHDEWWIALDEKIGSNWDAGNTTGGYYLNFHNVSRDVGDTGNGGIGWGFGSGVSPISLNYGSATANPGINGRNVLHLEYAGIPNYGVALPDPGPGHWESLLMHVVFGRTDGTTKRPGSIQVWYNGQDKPVVDLQNINILQKAVNPANGQTYVQQWVDVWQGGPYSKGDPCRSLGAVTRTSQVVAARFGTTLQQALSDTNITLDQQASYGSVHENGQPNYGNSSHILSSTQRTTADFLLPPSLAAQAGAAVPPATTTTPTTTTTATPPTAPPTGDAGWRAVVDSGCTACKVAAVNGTVTASIGGGPDNVDTAEDIRDLGLQTGPVTVSDKLGLATGQSLAGNLSVLQMRSSTNQLDYELYVAPDRTLHLWSPAGGLRSTEINQSTGVVVPNDGSTIPVQVTDTPNASIDIKVNGADKLVVSNLSGATSANQASLVAGIDHYDSGKSTDPVTVVHGAVTATAGSVPAPPTTTTPPTTTAPPTTTTPPTTTAPPASNDAAWRPVVDSGCAACKVAAAGGTVTASIGGGPDNVDTAEDIRDLGSQTGPVTVSDNLGLAKGQSLAGNLSVLQTRSSAGQLVYELYVAPDRTLHLWSPAGGLRSAEINQSTGVVVPNDGSTIAVQVTAAPNASIGIKVNGTDKLVVSNLSGAVTGNQASLVAGIDHYDSGTSNDPVTVVHGAVTATAGSTPAPPTTTTPPATTAPAPSSLVPDGDVESDPTAFWYAIADGGNYSWDTVAHSGAHSLKIVSTVTGQTRWMSQGRIPATAGTTYTASAYVTATGSPATIAVVFWDAQGHALGTIESSGATSSSWTQVSVRGGAPAGTAYARVELRLHGAGTLRADDVALAAS